MREAQDPREPSREPLRFEATTEWLRADGEAADVVLSSRVRLARNLSTSPFGLKAVRADRLNTLDLCRSCLLQSGLAERVVWLDVHERNTTERNLLVERHLISKPFSRGRSVGGAPAGNDPRGLAFSVPDERLAVMVNEEDHLRIQVVHSGFALDAAWRQADAVDDLLEAGLPYAFSPRLGYLTACPTNVGTGLRMSVMLHLPALRLTGELEKVKRAASDMALAVRGYYGEGSEAAGDLFQLSNQTTLGKAERTILHELATEIIPRIIAYERHARHELLSKRRLAVEDHANRALALLTHARLLATDEAMQHLSMVRLGVMLGLFPGLDQARVNQLLLLVQPAHLQLATGRELDQEQRRAARAQLTRARLTN